MNITQLYIDHNIPFVTEGHKHSRPGWINIPCPFCSGHNGMHMGYHLEDEYYVCWRCGSHSVNDVLQKLLNLTYKDIPAILKQYSGTQLQRVTSKVKVLIHPFKLPSPLMSEFGIAHRRYLEGRNFDPDKIIREWEISAAGLYCRLDNLDYKHRIIIPIKWDGKIVNFQGRDITGKSEQKYMACPESREEINIKKTLYGQQDKWGQIGIGVEGVMDVWRLGKYGVGLYGVKYKPIQVRLIAKRFKRFFVLFDPDRAGQLAGQKLVSELRFRGVEAYNIPLIDKDPAEHTDEEARALIRDLRTYKVS